MLVSSEHLNYLQRIGLNNDPSLLSQKGSSATGRSVIQIKGYGLPGKDFVSKSSDLPTKDLLTGLYASKIPVAFFISGSGASLDFFIGTWSTQGNGKDPAIQKELEQKIGVIQTTLDGAYPAIQMSLCNEDVMQGVNFTQAGLIMGVPTIKLTDTANPVLPIERLIQTMVGLNWGCLILAQPVMQTKTNELRLAAIDEMKRVTTQAPGETSNPIAQYYTDALTNTVMSFTLGLIGGNWRTGVYLLGDEKSYSRLASGWVGIYSGDESYPDAISLLSSSSVLQLAKSWTLPDVNEIVGPAPARYQHPLKYQTLLNSGQLSAYIHLPQKETSGFAIRVLPNFDVVPPKITTQRTIDIGEITQRLKPTGHNYLVDLDTLKGHAFVSGITNSGKTNTMFQILTQAAEFDLPFLVIEPAKTEYRALTHAGKLKNKLHIFTPGNELISPFRMNPFEVVGMPEISIGKHIDLLRSVFCSSFGMWDPLPQLLEKCLVQIYEDKGWDIAANYNHRMTNSSDVSYAFPTLSDLAEKATHIISDSGYASEIKDNMKTALLTRINSLQIGSKGRMLDVQESLPMKCLLENPTILELEGLGDDDDKAFIMGLLFIRLVEYRFAGGESQSLKHLFVIEEAHRLLTNVDIHAGQSEGNPKGKAVESFSNLLSEIRAFGQGIIVVDQVPVKLAPDVIKNTNTKIIHKCLSLDDRIVLAGSVGMNDIQRDSIASFTVGQVVVFSLGDDRPIMVKVPESPYMHITMPDNEVITYLGGCSGLSGYRPNYQPLSEFIVPQSDARMTTLSRQLGCSGAFQEKVKSMILSLVDDDNTVDIFFGRMVSDIIQALKEGMNRLSFQKAVFYFATNYYTNQKGYEFGWSYTDTQAFELALRNLFFSRLSSDGVMPTQKVSQQSLDSLRGCISKLYPRTFEPFTGCDKVCNQKNRTCLYRPSVADFIAHSKDDLSYQFDTAYSTEPSETQPGKSTWELCSSSARAIGMLKASEHISAKRIGLCIAQHLLKDKPIPVQEEILAELIKESTIHT